MGVFKNLKKAKETLEELCEKYKLCKNLLGLEKTNGACFGYQIEKCGGACQGSEPCINYNVRFAEAFSDLRIKKWPFEGPILLKEGKKAHLIDKWCYLGLVDENTLEIPSKNKDLMFDYRTYKILVKFLLNDKISGNIKLLDEGYLAKYARLNL